MVLGLLDQLQIFSQLFLIKLLGLLTGLGVLKLLHLIYPRLLTGFGMLVFFTNLSLTEFQVRYLALFFLFSVIDGVEWFWMENLHRNTQLMFLKAPYLVLHFSCNILMTFLTMLSAILISMLMILLFILSDQASDLWQQLELASELESDLQGTAELGNLNLLYKTLDWGKKWFVDLNAGKTQLVSFDQSNNTGSTDVKIDGSVLEEKQSFKMMGLNFSSKLDWALTLSLLLKLPPRKLEL